MPFGPVHEKRGNDRPGTGHEGVYALGKGDRSMNGSVENDLTPFTVKTSRMLLVVIQDRGWESAKMGTGRDGAT